MPRTQQPGSRFRRIYQRLSAAELSAPEQDAPLSLDELGLEPGGQRVALAFGVGYWLSTEYELPRLDLYYLLGGVLLLWALGQAAAWQPSRRAARISPSVATRTV